MILEAMLQRLYSSLQRGPCLNARPHNSRQRVDLTQLQHLQSVSPDAVLPSLLGNAKKVTLPASVPIFRKPDYPESEWSDEQKKHAQQYDLQSKLLKKLHDVATDAQEYFNDHGEIALYLGFPVISLPPKAGDDILRSSRILAPLTLVPINLTVRKGAKAGVTLAASGDGADLLIPNPALLAWIEQQTGHEIPELFEDDTGEEPEKEFEEILAFIRKALGSDLDEFTFSTSLKPIPKADSLPNEPALIPGAILGLFPMANPGLLRDTKWMIGEEKSLQGPVAHYLGNEVLEVPPQLDELPPSLPEQDLTHSAKVFDSEYFIAPIDPSQASTADSASKANALVIHGPPGTGKSQTITNIIGDHLAKGQRILFVCDKRTALDVVMHRLEHYGLGHLCGIIHDPARDRRDLYMGLRDRLESLVENEPLSDISRQLGALNKRLADLNKELAGYFELLHKQAADSDYSFHELAGRWYTYSHEASDVLPAGVTPELTLETVEGHRTDIHEAMNRALSGNLKSNPFFESTNLTLDGFFKLGTAGVREQINGLIEQAQGIDANIAEGLVPLDPSSPLQQQADTRKNIAEALKGILDKGSPEIAARISQMPIDTLESWLKEWHKLQDLAHLLNDDLEREWMLLLSNRLPALGETTKNLSALEEYAGTKGSIFRFIHFKKKGAAKQALQQLNITVTDDNVDRAIAFYSGARARWLLADLYTRIFSSEMSAEDDAGLRPAIVTLAKVFTIIDAFNGAIFNNALYQQVHTALSDQDSINTCLSLLESSSQRALAISGFIVVSKGLGLFKDTYLEETDKGFRKNDSAVSLHARWLEHIPQIEDVIRLEDALTKYPAELRQALRLLALAESTAEQAETDLMQVACENAIRALVDKHPDILRVDNARISAAFEEYGRSLVEKRELVRHYILHRWDKKQRQRLLASTGSRMNSMGAGLRNRLYVRGKKALKLRQMIAAGENLEDGDPLFDLCPVWMASPSTVAQIFPRREMFDLVVFDEASQCRLEEALPVLLRGKRVVVAGDPKQLPPTRFFESNIAESDDTDAETMEELAEQRMSETEDLLSASLNLDVEEAFLDVHYRSRSEALIGFSNTAFYNKRLQPIPGHPRNKALQTPIRLTDVNGTYTERTNPAEALAIVELVNELLSEPEPPSIGIVSFNINQRDLIIEVLEERVEKDREFAERFGIARKRRGRDSFEGLFVRNLESVQGDERDHIIISTTFGPDAEGKFRRNFGALSRVGGDRRLNVLVTRARAVIHVFTSIPTGEYRSDMMPETGNITGRHQLYAYLRYAEYIEEMFESYQDYLEGLKKGNDPICDVIETEESSALAMQIGKTLKEHKGIGSTVHWGNDGFCVDVALTHPALPEDVTLGVLVDFNRFRKTPDPIAWEYFRTEVLDSQGWQLERLWSPIFAREPAEMIERIAKAHETKATEGQADHEELDEGSKVN